MYYDTSHDVNIKLTSQTLSVKRRALKAKWSVDTAVMLQQEHNTDIEQDLIDKVMGVKQEMMPEQYSRYKKLRGLYDER